ncbi:MAG: phosphate acetyltransferase [Bacteroidales bacterium]|nr:phosphate acetyltransferase [Bacteroidales bacterium]
MITRLTQLAELVKSSGRRYRIAIAWAQDSNSIGALFKGVCDGFLEAVLIGKKPEIIKACEKENIDYSGLNIIESASDYEACRRAVDMARSGEADIVMKGLVGTDRFLKAVMDKETGLMEPGATLSYVCALDIPAYRKLLFITDPAVIPFPDLEQKIAMTRYAIEMAGRFGITKPRIALIGATEKISRHFQSSLDYSVMCKMAERGQLPDCIMDGPVDIFLACDPKSPEIKNVRTVLEGDADILVFPSIESCNPFYKGLMLFAGAELAGLICGTVKPVVLMSRNESLLSKYYCIALACMMTKSSNNQTQMK